MKTASVSAPSTSSFEADTRPVRGGPARILAAALAAGSLLAATALIPQALASKKSEQIPRKVRMDVHWGERKNREIYRIEMQRAVVTALAEKECFQGVLEGEEAKGDLVLEVQLNDFLTEQEYDSPEAMFPGQGEEHTLLSARVSVNLDFWLHPEGKYDVEILSGHFFREVVREPVSPTDPVEDRALFDLTTDAGRWVARDLCDRRGRLRSKVAEALAAPGAAAAR